MKVQTLLVLAVGLAAWACPAARAGDVKIIANPNVRIGTISAREVKRVFLEQDKALPDGSHVEPVLKKGGAAHEAFLREYLEETQDDLQNYYRALVFGGRGSMPKELNSDEEMVAYVAKTRGAIGYVSEAAAVESVKTLLVVSDKSHGQRMLVSHEDPAYPELLRKLQIGGTVRLGVTISAGGNVEKVQLLGGNPILAESAIEAVKHWVFAPGHSRTTTEISIPFEPRR
jgi:TonB family protein